MSFLAGALTTATVWVLFLWWRNPHGHRGGQELNQGITLYPNNMPLSASDAIPVRYHRTG